MINKINKVQYDMLSLSSSLNNEITKKIVYEGNTNCFKMDQDFLAIISATIETTLVSSSQCNFQYKRIIKVYINHIFIALPLEDEMIFPTGCLRN